VNDDPGLVTVRIMDKEYRVTCEKNEIEALQKAALHLDDKMREIRANGKVLGADRIAVMAALNIAHEFLQQGNERKKMHRDLDKRIRGLQNKIEIALNHNSELEVKS
jgi:cell division protein ZapA